MKRKDFSEITMSRKEVSAVLLDELSTEQKETILADYIKRNTDMKRIAEIKYYPANGICVAKGVWEEAEVVPPKKKKYRKERRM